MLFQENVFFFFFFFVFFQSLIFEKQTGTERNTDKFQTKKLF